jgi:DNA-directed RNA polymerase omega subunit
MAENNEELNTEETEIEEGPDLSIYDSPKIDSKYRRIILAAQRSKQLQRGAQSRTSIDVRTHKPTRVALRELEDHVIKYRIIEPGTE